MRIKYDITSLNIEELKSALEKKYFDYTIKINGKNSIIGIKSKTTGIFITFYKKYIQIEVDFPIWNARLIYYLSYLVLGIIIPVIIYYTVFYRKFKKTEKDIGNFIKLQCCSEEI